MTNLEKIAQAQNYNTPPERLKILATEENLNVRCYVACHQNTPVEVLQMMATDNNWMVRRKVANNPNTPVETLQILATDEHYYVRLLVGRNSSSTEICRRLVLMTNDKESLSKTP